MSFTYLIKNDVRIFGSMGEVLHNAYVLSQKDSFSSFQRPKWFNVKLDLLDMKYYQGKQDSFYHKNAVLPNGRTKRKAV